MSRSLHYGRATYHYNDFDANEFCRPAPVMRLRPVLFRGTKVQPKLGDRTMLLLLHRRMPKQVAFARAYVGWLESGQRELRELGEGRAFFRWLQKHELAIEWHAHDIQLHPLFSDPEAPKHDPQDETARGLSFAIAPQLVDGRRVKLYVQDQDMLKLIHTDYGNEIDFAHLIADYIRQRWQWQSWNAPAPTFVEWIMSQGKRAIFRVGQLGFHLPC